MADRINERMPCEFFLVRYVPDVVKGEFVNIGVVLRESGVSGDRPDPVRSRIRFTRDWSRVRCMDEDADTDMLEALEAEIALRLQTGISVRDPKAVLDVLEDSLSNSVQISEAKATLAENMATEMELLLRMYVEPLKVARVRARSPRATIQTAMRKEFERAGAWPLMRRKIAAALYTQAGDPLRIDCGYAAVDTAAAQGGSRVPGGFVRMFQAVSLEGDVESAKGLAFSSASLREGVRRVEGAALELTAVVEPFSSLDGEDAQERYRFGVDAMERDAIRVITVSDLVRAAETARRELGL